LQPALRQNLCCPAAGSARTHHNDIVRTLSHYLDNMVLS
jgi:hypothetical protein